MVVTVKYTAQLKQAAGTASERIELEKAAELEDLLQVLIQRHNKQFAAVLLDAKGRYSGAVVPILNGKQIRAGEKIVFKPGDELMLLSAIAGG